MAVNWLIGAQQGPSIGEQFQQGVEHGRQVHQFNERHNALQGYVNNPNDPAAQNALTVADPGLGLQMRDQRLQEDHARHQQAAEALGEHRDRIIMGAQFLQNVHDEAGYQQALQLARQNGIPLDDVPQHFDPQYVQGIVTIAGHLQAVEHPQTQQAPNIQREVEYYRSIGRPEMADQLLTNHAAGAPVVFDVNGDGAPDLVPRSYFNSGQQAPPAAGHPNEAQLRAQADEAIRGGADPAAVNARLNQMLGGGAGQPQAQGTFPRQDGGAFDFSVRPTSR